MTNLMVFNYLMDTDVTDVTEDHFVAVFTFRLITITHNHTHINYLQ